MCLTVFFILWESIEQYRYRQQGWHRPSITPHHSYNSPSNSTNHTNQTEHHDVNHFSVDCAKSTTGLFNGIFALLLTIISLITYFIYKKHDPITAIKLSETTELCLLLVSMVIIVLILVKLKYHKFSHKVEEKMSYNEILIIIGLAGIYLYGFYSIIAILNNGLSSNIENLSLLIQIFSIIESTMQSILIINGFKMYSRCKLVLKKKPARSLITLLILIDVSLWLSETLSVKKYDMNTVQLDYYDIVFWSIVSSISSPLAIFFRFHASVCLSDIWKTLYE